MTPKELQMIKWAMDMLREKVETEFFGDVTFRFQEGRITISEIKEQRKPPKG